MDDIKIPFALNKNGALVEVGNVKQGRACECICPSCKQSLIARQGPINSWHFAHDTTPSEKPDTLCEISFFSCCRQFLIDNLVSGKLTDLLTPDLIIEEHAGAYGQYRESRMVKSAKKFSHLSYRQSSYADCLTSIKGFNLYLFFIYPGRPNPSSPPDSQDGVMAINLEPIKNAYQDHYREKDSILNHLNILLNSELDYKKWLYHPSEKGARKKLKKDLENKYPSARKGRFDCIKCKNKWIGMSDEKKCTKCGDYLHSRFVPFSDQNG